MTLSIIIVSYNTKDLLNQCLTSVFAQSPSRSSAQSLEVIVVDNASTDGSPAMVTKTFPQVTLVRNAQNLGFGRASDLGAKLVTGDYLFFLNSDTQLTKDCLKTLIHQLQTHKPAIATCRLTNPDGTLQPQGGYLPNLLRIALWMLNLDNLPIIRTLIKPYQLRYPAFFNQDQTMGWIGGTAMLVNRSVFNELNGFDREIFMYAEDVDLCFRAHRQGYSIQYYSKPSILHLGQGTGTLNSILGEIAGLKYYFRKHKSPWQLLMVRMFIKLGCLLRRLVFAIIGQHERKTLYQKAFKLA